MWLNINFGGEQEVGGDGSTRSWSQRMKVQPLCGTRRYRPPKEAANSRTPEHTRHLNAAVSDVRRFVLQGGAGSLATQGLFRQVAVDTALHALRGGKAVLAHCVAGRHRSSVFAITVIACRMHLPWSVAKQVYLDARSRLTDYDVEVIEQIAQKRKLHKWIVEYQASAAAASSSTDPTAKGSVGSCGSGGSGGSGVRDSPPRKPPQPPHPPPVSLTRKNTDRDEKGTDDNKESTDDGPLGPGLTVVPKASKTCRSKAVTLPTVHTMTSPKAKEKMRLRSPPNGPKGKAKAVASQPKGQVPDEMMPRMRSPPPKRQPSPSPSANNAKKSKARPLHEASAAAADDDREEVTRKFWCSGGPAFSCSGGLKSCRCGASSGGPEFWCFWCSGDGREQTRRAGCCEVDGESHTGGGVGVGV